VPFYIRKSVKAGPFRFNLSKSGIGVSAGVKGLRIGTGPRGHYVHAGRGGLYYRSSIPSRKHSSKTASTKINPEINTSSSDKNYEVEMIRVSSASVLEMEDSRFADLLAEMNLKQQSASMKNILGWLGAAVGIFATLGAGSTGLIVGTIMTLAGVVMGSRIDSFRRTSVLIYDLDPGARDAYKQMTEKFDRMSNCSSKWHVDAGGAVRDIHTWKRNAGASHLLDKKPTELGYKLPKTIKCNVDPPFIQSGKELLYFMPDFLLVLDGNKVGAVPYDKLQIRWEDSNFIEEGVVPSDSTVISQTWKHPNKSGGPDRRFSNNVQIPICRYESVYFQSSKGLNELLQFSRSGVTQPFAEAITVLAKSNGSQKSGISVPQLT
jgi:hypothetical protein